MDGQKPAYGRVLAGWLVDRPFGELKGVLKRTPTTNVVICREGYYGPHPHLACLVAE